MTTICMECRDGKHNKPYRVFCETVVFARDMDQGFEIGCQELDDEKYQIENWKSEL